MNFLQTFIFRLPLPAFTMDRVGALLDRNGRFSDLFRDCTSPLEPHEVRPLLNLAESGEKVIHARVQAGSGGTYNVLGLVADEKIICTFLDAPEEGRIFSLFRLVPFIAQSASSYWIMDRNGEIVYANRSFEELTGYSAQECLGQRPDFLRSPKHGMDIYDDMWATLQTGNTYRGVVFNQNRAGQLLICEEIISPVRNEQSDIEWFIATDNDMTEQLKLQTQLRQSKEHLQRVIEWAPLGVGVGNLSGKITEANAALASMLKYTREELCGMNVSKFVHPEDLENEAVRASRFESAFDQSYSLVRRFIRKDGEVIWASVHLALLPAGPDEAEPSIIGMVEDITERRADTFRLHATLTELQDLQESVDTIALRLQTDAAGIVQSANGNFLNLIGRQLEDIQGRPLDDIFPRAEGGPVELLAAIRAGNFWRGELEVFSERGLKHWLETMLIPRVDEGGAIRSIRILLFDVTLRKRAEEALVYQAFHDSLTGLPNRSLLLDRLFTAISRARRSKERIAVLFLDLDRFKSINDALGHTIGDRVLKRAADRLQSLLREYDTVARTGGDEFVLLIPGLEMGSQVVTVVERIQELMCEPFEIDGHELHVPTSIGISVFPEDGTDPETLIKNADIALYRAKDLGRNCFVYYNADQNVYSHDRLVLENEMRKALRDNQFCLFFQPQVDIINGRLIGFETLARWKHPVRGLVSPGIFIPIAEETGMILQLGDQVLRDSFRTAATWRSLYSGSFHLSVNISGRQFYQKRFLPDLLEMRDTYQMPPGFLELEITESIAMQMTPSTMEILLRLRSEGFSIALDDFGTGYSSLTYLREFPLDVLKIDRSFIVGLESDQKKQNILRSIMDMARYLDLKIVAEGVELESQLNLLKEMGCERVQGYYYSPPVAEEAALQFFSRSF